VSDWNAARYDEELAQGLSLAGEDAMYFAQHRARAVRERVSSIGLPVSRVCEFGCGLGRNLKALAAVFPHARLLGLDAAPTMVQRARELCTDDRIEFRDSTGADDDSPFDLVFLNGVMHHVPREERSALMHRLRALLKPGGMLAIFDNNPLNPGAMWVMRRIPFDRDAQPLLPWTLERLAIAAGLRATAIRTHFYFPNALRALRGVEPWLTRVPLGAQYVVYARR
jgi:2-polyprenyl-3-methyl-5-hydroxy-6-metoxy-1,4-benzoquinol methylase